MSANLWDVSAANFKPDADGVYNVGKTTGELDCSIAGASALTENQTVHFGASLRGAGKGYLSPFVEYKYAAGKLNWVGFPHWTPTDQWQRFDGSCVVPSGMTPTRIGFNTHGATGNMEVLNPTFSYGSPVCLASSAHTPYATQDHVSVTYATKASLKVTDDSIKAEVSARAQTDQNVADLSSRLTQTANSLSSEISDRKSAITTVTGLANTAQSTADAAKSSASNAVSTANSASSSAANAVKTANAASSTASAASTAAGKASTDAAAALAETKDLVTMRIDSSRGTVFKNSEISTVLFVRCYKRGQELTTLTALRQAMLDATARIRWYVLREGDTDWVSLADSDPMLSNDGFTLTVTPSDVSVKCTFKAEIVTD